MRSSNREQLRFVEETMYGVRAPERGLNRTPVNNEVWASRERTEPIKLNVSSRFMQNPSLQFRYTKPDAVGEMEVAAYFAVPTLRSRDELDNAFPIEPRP